ncbi:13905_t:CDS:2, partial [Entrophospora sp. SA101]
MKGNYATVLRITRFSATFDKSGLCCEFALNASQLVSKNLDFFEIMWDHCSTILQDLHPNIQVIVFFGDPSTGKIIDHITSQPVCDDQKNPCPKANTPFSTTVE